jgi:purine-nucleoside phosphorylase
MEAHLLYKLAIRFNKKALAVCTVSDLLNRKESMSPVERETGFGDMIKIVLETI